MPQYAITLIKNWPNQKFNITAIKSGKVVELRVFEIYNDTYVDVFIDSKACTLGRALHNNEKLNLRPWTYQDEWIYFTDSLGSKDPRFQEYNDRYKLIYEF